MSTYIVRGTDPILRDAALDELVRGLLGDDDRTLAREDFTIPGRATGEGDGGGAEAREDAVAAVLNSAQSPPFMTARRIVVVRDVGNLTAADAAALAPYLADPLDTTELVFVSGGSRIPDALARQLKAIKAREVGPSAEKTSDVLATSLSDAGIRLRPDAVHAVSRHLGEDAGRVPALVSTLAASFGEGVTLDADDVAPYLGGVGAVPGYELTNAVDAGDVPGALDVLTRLLTASGGRQARPMHSLQVLGLLHSHYRRMLRLDDPAVRTTADAVAALGGKVRDYPARKAREAARALGSDGLRRAFDHLHQADLDLKGARAIPPEVVLEILVTRLAGLASRAGGSQPSRPGRRRRQA